MYKLCSSCCRFFLFIYDIVDFMLSHTDNNHFQDILMVCADPEGVGDRGSGPP